MCVGCVCVYTYVLLPQIKHCKGTTESIWQACEKQKGPVFYFLFRKKKKNFDASISFLHVETEEQKLKNFP